MIQSLKQIKGRIRGVESVGKITRAMEVVSHAKLNTAQEHFLSAREYYNAIQKMLQQTLSSLEHFSSPFLEKRSGKKKITLCVVTSDTGLCGNHNHIAIRMAEGFLELHKDSPVSLVCVGKRGYLYFKKRGFSIADTYTALHGRCSDAAVDALASELIGKFLSCETDEVYCTYAYFESASRSSFIVEKILPLENKKDIIREYLFEPAANELLKELLPLCIFSKIRLMLLSAFSVEHSARLLAMGEATANAKELFEGLVLLRNKVRQTTITNEILEVISSADVLKG